MPFFSPQFILKSTAAGATFANLLLSGETDGFAIDATNASQTNGGYVSVKDTGTPANNLSNVALDASNLTQAGTSAKQVHWSSSPFVRWTPHNMFLNSASPATQSVTVVTGFIYTVTVTGSGSMAGSSGASGTASAGSPATFTATGTTATWTITGSLTTIQMNRGVTATPYIATTGSIRIGIPQDYDAATSNFALAIEIAATNIALRSQEQDDAAWTKSNTTITADNTTAPDNSSTADRINVTAGSAEHKTEQALSGGGLTTTVSCYLKAGTHNFAMLGILFNTDANTWVYAVANLSNGTITQSGAGSGNGVAIITPTITSVGNGWYRLAVGGTTPSVSSSHVSVQIPPNGTPTIGTYTNITWTAAGTETVFAWGYQAENSNGASSYIRTLGSSVTRAADNVGLLLSTVPTFSGTGVSGYLQAKRLTDGCDLVAYDDGSNNNLFSLTEQAVNSDKQELFVFSGGALQADVQTTTSITKNTVFKGAFRVATNSANHAKDGTAATADTSVTVPVSPTTLKIGRSSASIAGNKRIYYLVFLPRTMLDAELVTKST